MTLVKLKKLPTKPGVYLFKNKRGEIIYVGKASNLKSRVSSYFKNSTLDDQHHRPIEEMMRKVADIKWVATDSALEAALREGEYIKKFQPRYNVKWRDDKSWNYILITSEDYPQLLLRRAHELDKIDRKEFKNIFGPFPELNVKATLSILRRIFHYSVCQPLSGKPCFYRQLSECLGVCTGEITPRQYRAKVIRPMTIFLRGGKKRLIKNLSKDMARAAKRQDFEEAQRLRDQIKALKHIHDVALLNESFVKDKVQKFRNKLRIEGYDISNLGSLGKVGSLVVFDDRYANPREYKRFQIKKVLGQSDVDCLAEVLERRMRHSEWPFPDLILIDGGKPQVNRTLEVLRGAKLKIPVVGLAKGPTRKNNRLIFGAKEKIWQEWTKNNLKLLVRVRDEAHRFAISYYRERHRKVFISK